MVNGKKTRPEGGKVHVYRGGSQGLVVIQTRCMESPYWKGKKDLEEVSEKGMWFLESNIQDTRTVKGQMAWGRLYLASVWWNRLS